MIANTTPPPSGSGAVGEPYSLTIYQDGVSQTLKITNNSDNTIHFTPATASSFTTRKLTKGGMTSVTSNYKVGLSIFSGDDTGADVDLVAVIAGYYSNGYKFKGYGNKDGKFFVKDITSTSTDYEFNAFAPQS